MGAIDSGENAADIDRAVTLAGQGVHAVVRPGTGIERGVKTPVRVQPRQPPGGNGIHC